MDFNAIDVGALIVVGVFILVWVFTYIRNKANMEEYSKLFTIVMQAVSDIDDFEIGNEEKKEKVLDSILSVLDHLDIQVDEAKIDDMIETAVFMLHKAREIIGN